MDGISDRLNKIIKKEVMLADIEKLAFELKQKRRPLTRARIDEIKDRIKLDKEYE
tara:strand:- start:1642 stop:1806 length:165 start_codon:yes stop_codon:yes gene_type:complete